MREPVHTIDDYYDGPRRGFADFDGKPQYYECEFDERADEYSNVFRLVPVPDSIFKFAMEQWQIWCRWRGAFNAGEVALDTHPALTKQPPRYAELKGIVDRYIADARTNFVRAQARFLDSPSKRSVAEVEWVRLGR